MTVSSRPPNTADGSFSLVSVFALLRRRKSLLFWPAAVALLLAASSCLLSVSRYRATAEIQVQKDTGGAFGLDSAAAAGAGNPGDSLDYTMTLQTEIGILRSPALAIAVVEAEHLEATPDYFGEPKSAAKASLGGMLSRPLAQLRRLLPASSLEPVSIPLAQAPNRRYAAERIFKAHLKVTPLTGTRLIDVGYADRDPVRAAEVANTITRVLADLSFRQHFTSTLQGSAWLAGQLDELRKRTEQAQARAVALQRGTGMFGNDASRNVVLERLDSLNQALTAAESNRILKESIDRVASEGSPELISSLSGNSSTGSVASINTSLSLIQGLRQQEAQVRAELAENSVRYGPAYPKIAELHAQLDGIMTSIAAEVARLGQRAHTDRQIAVRQEQAARAAFEQQKLLASRQNDGVLAYELAREEADSSRDLYEGLLGKLKQTSLLEGLRANDVSIVPPALVPPPAHPPAPNIRRRLGGGAAGGLLLGFCAVTLRELADGSVRSIPEVEALLGAPLLAVLPSFADPSLRTGLCGTSPIRGRLGDGWAAWHTDRAKPTVPVVEARQSAFSEGLRSLRSAILLSHRPGPRQTILLCSPLAGEGKTTLALNLAASLAQGGSRVLLVDADLRHRSLQRFGESTPSEGLGLALSGPESVAFQTPVQTLPQLRMLSGSELPPWPAELLASGRMAGLVAEWRTAFDHIIFDSPPLLAVTDAVLLSQHCDLALLVARHTRTPAQALCRAVDLLKNCGSPDIPVGVILNDVAKGSGEFREYFGHKGEHDAYPGA